MKIKALVTALVLGTSSLAMAKPAYDPKFDVDANLSFRGDWHHRMARRWVPLAETVTSARRNVINISEAKDDLSAIRLMNQSGATYVYSILLRFDDGSRKEITVGKWLYAGAPLLQFDLVQNREGLSRIVVTTWTSRPATYSVEGLRSRRMRPPVIGGDELPTPPLPPVQRATMIGTDLSFANTPGYVHLPVGLEKGRFSMMRIEGTGSSTYIGTVFVTFANGNQQRFEVNKSLYRGQSMDLDLDGGANGIIAITLLATNDVHAVGPSASKFNVALL